MREYWKPIEGYEGFYEVSNYGRIKSLIDCNGKPRELILKPCYNKLRYASVFLCKHGYMKRKQIHRIVAQAFIPNPLNYPIINHKDENPSNNKADNLEWCTQKYNINYGNRNAKCLNSLKNSKTVKTPRKLLCFSLSDEFICEYDSIHEAARAINGSIGLICLAAQGKRRIANGYKWEYKKGCQIH